MSNSATKNKDSSNTTFQFPRVYSSQSLDPPVFSSTDGFLGSAINNTRNTSSRTSPEPQAGQRDKEGHYVGSSSAVSFLIRIQKRLHQNSSISHDSSIFTFGDASLPEIDPSFFVLPPKGDAQRLVERYFDYAAPTHRFLHRPSIENLVDEFYETHGEMKGENGKSRAALLMVVFAQAQAYMPPGTTAHDDRYIAKSILCESLS